MTDSPSRVERVLNLLALLLDTQRPLTREEIVQEVSGYPPQVSANRRAFERDKEILRGMGVPITVEPIPESAETGYRVRPDDYYLPDLGLSDDETAALNVAVSAVALGNPDGQGALMKLGGGTVQAQAPIASLPLVPALAPLFDAFRRRACVTFVHRGRERTLEPWGLTSQRGHWYVVGWDRDREAVRAFRADRIDDEVVVGEPEAFTPPPDFRPDDHVEDRPWLYGEGTPVPVTLAVDADYAEALFAELGGEATVEPGPDGRARVELPVLNRGALRGFALGFLDHVEIVAPDDIRAEMITWLESAAQERKA